MFQALDDSYEESNKKDSEISILGLTMAWNSVLRNSMNSVEMKALQDIILYAILCTIMDFLKE